MMASALRTSSRSGAASGASCLSSRDISVWKLHPSRSACHGCAKCQRGGWSPRPCSKCRVVWPEGAWPDNLEAGRRAACRRSVGVVRVALLGPLAVHAGPVSVALAAPKERAVLEMLALRAGRPVPPELLSSGLWGESEPASAHKAVQVYVSHLRRALPPDSVLTTAAGYVLQLDAMSVDASVFERTMTEAGQRQASGDQRKAAEMLRDALELWRGPCPELAEHSWATAELGRLAELRRVAEEELVDARVAMGEHARLVGELEAAVDEEPLRERRWAQLMLALYRAGRQADALRAFTRLRKNLAQDLGIEPSSELVALEQAVLLHSPDLDYRPLPEAAGAAPQHPGALPAPTSTFIGRTAEMAEVENLVADRRLVTLAGAGGCGKTRLALEVAGRLGDRFAGGAYFVALAPVADGALVGTAVAEALGVLSPSERLVDVVGDVIGHRPTLLVLDNCEHVVGEAAELAEKVLGAAPGLRLLVTSRDPLRIVGETVWRVPSLPVPASGVDAQECRASVAVQLFVDRALAAHPGLSLDDEATTTIAEITRRLDGMPLAIELAAARAGVLDLKSVLEGLNDRFTLLASGSRTAPARQTALRAAVAWSYELLSAAEKDLFRRLSVFPGSFSLDAAVAVAQPPVPEAAEDLFALVAKSMVGTVALEGWPTRYFLLETLRQFGAGELDDAAAEQARAEHAAFYLAVAESAALSHPGGGLWGRSSESTWSSTTSGPLLVPSGASRAPRRTGTRPGWIAPLHDHLQRATAGMPALRPRSSGRRWSYGSPRAPGAGPGHRVDGSHRIRLRGERAVRGGRTRPRCKRGRRPGFGPRHRHAGPGARTGGVQG